MGWAESTRRGSQAEIGLQGLDVKGRGWRDGGNCTVGGERLDGKVGEELARRRAANGALVFRGEGR